MPTPPHDPTTPRCPHCGEVNLRLSRHRSQGEAGPSGLAARRYRCRATDCGWRGSLPLRFARVSAWWRAAAEPARRVLLGLGLLAAIGVSGGVLLVSGLETWGRHVAGLDPAPGRNHDGLPLAPAAWPQGGQALLTQATVAAAPAASASSAGLPLRHGCAWGEPGRNPYRGSTEQALTAAGLPPEVVRQIAAQRQAGRRAGRLQISRDAIRLDDGSRAFNPRRMAMSFGTTLCLNSRVNFAPGHVEAADLFEARDEQGRVHAVMVPDVCGNVTVLGARAAGGVVAGVSGALADRSLALASVAAALAAAPSDPGTAAVGGAGAADGGRPGLADGARPGAPGHTGPDGAEAKPGPGEGDQDAQPAGAPRAPAPGAEAGGSGSGSRSSERSGDGSPGAGGAGDPAGAQRDGPAAVWVGLGTSGLARTVLIAGLNSSATVLAKAGTTIAALPTPGGERGTDLLSTRQNTLDARSIPEPGTLLCVLAALAGLAWMGRRG